MIFLLAAAAALTVHGDRLFVPVEINGVRIEAVLDSGAEMTILDKDFARRIGAKQGAKVTARGSGGGDADAQLIEHVRIEAAGVRVPDATIAVLDLGDIGRRLFGHGLDAIVGRDLFDAARLAIDIEGGTVEAVPRTRRPAGVKLPLSPHAGIETVPVTIEGGRPVQAEFDLGNGSDMLVGKAYAEKAGLLDPNRIVAHETGGGVGGAVKRDIVVLKTVRIAGVTFRNVRAAIDAQPNAADANIGVKLLRRFRIVTDFARHAVWLKPR